MCRAEVRPLAATANADAGKFKKVPTIGEIKAVIPSALFEKSLVHSFLATGRDLLIVAAFALLASTVLDTTFPGFSNPVALAYFLLGWSFYAFWQVATPPNRRALFASHNAHFRSCHRRVPHSPAYGSSHTNVDMARSPTAQ